MIALTACLKASEGTASELLFDVKGQICWMDKQPQR